jgi:hypothetical protein
LFGSHERALRLYLATSATHAVNLAPTGR